MRLKIIFLNVDVGDAYQFMGQGIPQSGSATANAAYPAFQRVLGTTRALLLEALMTWDI